MSHPSPYSKVGKCMSGIAQGNGTALNTTLMESNGSDLGSLAS